MSYIENLNRDDFRVVSGEDAIKIAHQWLSVFCPKRTSFKGIYRFKTYVWDEMTCEFQKDAALIEYENQISHEYVIMEDCFGHDRSEIYITNKKPTGNSYLEDFHVFPKNMAWSMSFTHEDSWIGPLFSKHPFYEKLNAKNVKAMRAVSQFK
ncbi:hypothetical protein FE810_13795 [Thalassotalea litorea]|uniref:DUF4275 family protein n=1 Tax=Thalassotalea litorea TaxID=2020715 RepID=A0A5R9IH45_9GAMM|nr:hypothetical protein [Thalassotalea litorea]TLU61884.1 hypothetical protein FE810_13795 [Thalassotalea litorea]